MESSNSPKQPFTRQVSEDDEVNLQQLEILQAQVRQQEERIRELKSLIAEHEVKLSHQTDDAEEEKEASHSTDEDEASDKDGDS